MAAEVATTRGRSVDTSDNSALTGRVIPPGSKPETEYVYLRNKSRNGNQGGGQVPEEGGSSNRPVRISAGRARPASGGALGNTNGIGYAWLASMIVIGFDEWKHNGILPRPARLWDTSLVFGLLALGSAIDLFAPLASALAWGYFFILLYQFYNKTGQFS